MSNPDEQREEVERGDRRSQWERPTLSPLGSVKDLVRGVTKSGRNFDSDPHNTKKPGIG